MYMGGGWCCCFFFLDSIILRCLWSLESEECVELQANQKWFGVEVCDLICTQAHTTHTCTLTRVHREIINVCALCIHAHSSRSNTKTNGWEKEDIWLPLTFCFISGLAAFLLLLLLAVDPLMVKPYRCIQYQEQEYHLKFNEIDRYLYDFPSFQWKKWRNDLLGSISGSLLCLGTFMAPFDFRATIHTHSHL